MNRLILSALLLATTATAQIKVGVIVSATGPAASLGIPERNTVALLPKRVANQDIEYIILDDASDTTTAVQNARKLIQENKVDVIIGTTTTPASLAMIDVVAEAKVPKISLAASESIIAPVDAKRSWVFKTPQTDAIMAAAIVQHMVANKIKTVGYIGFNDAYGEGWFNELQKERATTRHPHRRQRTLQPQRHERHRTGPQDRRGPPRRRADRRVGRSGRRAAEALNDRGYRGKIYQTHGVANSDFLRVGGKDVEGAILPAGPILVAEQLPDTNPNKRVSLNYIEAYEARYGEGSRSTFGAHMYDAGLLLQKAIPAALKKGKPGTAAFRDGLRDALEGTRNVIGTHGIFNMSATNHLGLDNRSRVMVTIENGTWKLLK
jgi:branched-chain amino acid transport system substrate-binding protein